jgi:hypothetical protein
LTTISLSGHADVDADVEELALMLVLVRHFDHYPARHDGLEESLEFLGFLTNMQFDRIGTFDVTKSDLQWGFHFVLLLLLAFTLDHGLGTQGPAQQNPA